MERAPKAAGIYARISLDRTGEGLGVQRQVESCRRLAAERGWPVADVYRDDSVSAHSGRRRPAYERMLSDIEAGRVDAVVCVDLDRLVRRPAELESFMALADSRGVLLANVSGDTDLSTSDGRLKARLLGAVAAQESERKAERVAREAEQAARRGLPRGSQRPFGWQADKVTVNPEEAELIREAAGRVLAGETVPAVAADWNRRSIPTPQGARHGWAGATLKNILRSPRLCGLRTYHSEIVAPGQWQPILDRQTWETLQARLPKGASPGRPGTRLLTGIARCGRCGGPLWASWQHDKGHRRERYACVRRPGSAGCGNLTVTGPALDQTVRDAVLHALTGPALARARRQHTGDDRQQAQAARDLADAENRKEQAAALFAAGDLSRREWMAVRAKADQRVQTARRILDRHALPLADLSGSEGELRQAWEAGTIGWRRALLAAVVDHITVAPSAGPANRFNPARVTISWRA